jgi:penicillin-binding protein 2
VDARVRLDEYPWIEVVPSHTRRYDGGEAVGQFLGLLREVDRGIIENDPSVEDDLARYLPGDRFGFCGIEGLAEQWLRGRRGRVHEDIQGRPLPDPPSAEPQNGRDFRLTIDLALHQQVYRRLAQAVREHGTLCTGGAAVILDIPSRQVLAMASYPSFDPNEPWEVRQKLAEDTLRQPTKFRVIGEGFAYPPGSIVKPMVLAAGLTEGRVGPEEEIVCRGHLLPDYPNKWRCAATWGHGSVKPVYSIQHSCNVFYYVVAERMGVRLLSEWMSRFGFGQRTGTGLWGENRGIVPDSGLPGVARNMGIGQGQLEITPMQAANMVATIASGVFRPVTIWLDDPSPRPAESLPVAENHWRIVRRGMHDAVNEPGGTAYEGGRLEGVGDLVLLGKTGSAEPAPQESLYTCRFPDGRVEVVRARNIHDLYAQFATDRRPEVLDQQEAAEYPTHGWFVGYLAPRSSYEQPVTSRRLSVAIAVVIEYAGHGGDVAAPVARDMMRFVIERQERGEAASPAGGEP